MSPVPEPEILRLLAMWDAARPDWRERRPALHLLAPGPCSYLQDRSWRLVLARDPDLDLLLEMGGQRFGEYFCLPACRGCRACVPARIEVERFAPRRSQRRTLRRNGDVSLEVGPVQFSQEKFLLLKNFLQQRFDLDYPEFHQPGATAGFYRRWLLYEGGGTLEFRYRVEGQLVGVGAVDPSPRGAYSHFFFYDLSFPRRRLGILSFLKEIEWCLTRGASYLYVGFYNSLCQSMRYKSQLPALQILVPSRGWTCLSEIEGGNLV